MLKFKKQGKWASIIAATLIIIAGTVCLTDAMNTKNSSTAGMKDTNMADTKTANTNAANTENTRLPNTGRKDPLTPNESSEDILTSNESHEAIIAEAVIHGYQVRIACLFDTADDSLQSKQDLEFGLYKGNFEIQTYKNNTRYASFRLQAADEIYFPADGFSLAIQDYDGDGDADDFALGQGQTPYPLLGNYMTYYFFT